MWLEAKIIKNKTSNEICEAVKELIFHKHGVPKTILTDCGLEFKNESTMRLSEHYGFEWIFSSPRHHETVGAVERVNKTLFNILKRLTNYGEKSWENQLNSAVYAYNISFHRALNTSPYVIKFAKTPTILIDTDLNKEE